MNNLMSIIDDLGRKHDFNKRIGTLAHSIAVEKLAREFENPSLKIELKKCENVNQMINVIQQKTGALTIERTPERLAKFEKNFYRLIKMARL